MKRNFFLLFSADPKGEVTSVVLTAASSGWLQRGQGIPGPCKLGAGQWVMSCVMSMSACVLVPAEAPT